MPKTTRNISGDLEKRLKALVVEREQTEEQLAEINRLIESFTLALNHEKRHWTKQLPLPLKTERGNMVRLVAETMADQQEWSLPRIAESVKSRGGDFGNKNPNRVVHFALIGMYQRGLVEIVRKGEGVWRATPKLLEQTKSESKTGEVVATNS